MESWIAIDGGLNAGRAHILGAAGQEEAKITGWTLVFAGFTIGDKS